MSKLFNVLIGNERVPYPAEQLAVDFPQEAEAMLFEAAKYEAVDYAHDYGDAMRRSLLDGVSELRRAAWPTKGRIAANIIKGNALEAEIATVQAEIDERDEGETVEQLAGIHLAKSVALLTVDNVIEGMTHKAAKAINACTTPAELKAVTDSFIELADTKKAAILATFNS